MQRNKSPMKLLEKFYVKNLIALIFPLLCASNAYSASTFTDFYNESSNWNSGIIGNGELTIDDEVTVAQDVTLCGNIQVVVIEGGQLINDSHQLTLSDCDDQRDSAWRVVEIYVATLGYAPDNEGLQYWVSNLQNGGWTPNDVAQSFFDAPLVQEMYPIEEGYDHFIEALYQNIFGRAPDEAGYEYWLTELDADRVQRNQMIIALIEGGWANAEATSDMARFGNQIQVGLAFATAQAERDILYTQLTEDQQIMLRHIGREILATVTDDSATREAAIGTIPNLLDQL